MVVSEGAISNIMGGMGSTAGVRLHSQRHKLKQRFDILRKLGQGTYGKVQLAVNKDTGQEVAIKTIKKAKIETEQDLVRIRREIQIMSSVQHPQIIHIYEVFENREKMVLVMEYAAGGELYDYLSERKVLSVDEARRVFRQVASAVYYCHKHKICHRDLKLENILLDIDGNAKIADFGLSNVFDEKRRLDTFCGSPLYASPEIVKGVPYVGPEVDCWSLGVLLYTLVYGAMPFDGSNFRRLVKQITQGDFYEPPTPSTASPLVRSMLTVSSEKRASIADICGHWWVNDGEATSCLDEAEALANQTPVRLDLLLSLAPKHISSEHLMIQPDDEEGNSQRSDDGQPGADAMHLPAAAQAAPEASGPQAARSLSLGALSTATARGPTLTTAATGAVPRRDEDKRRRESEARSSADSKKRKEAGHSATTLKPTAPQDPEESRKLSDSTADERKSKNEGVFNDVDVTMENSSRTDKSESDMPKEAMLGETVMDTDDRDVKTRVIVENDLSQADRVDNKKSTSSRDSASEAKDTQKKCFSNKKVTSSEKNASNKSAVVSMDISSEIMSGDSTPKALSPMPELRNEETHPSYASSSVTSSSETKPSSIRSPSNKSVISAVSTEGTLRASDSSLSTRHSVSPPKSVIEVPIDRKDKLVTASSAVKVAKNNLAAKVPSTSNVTKNTSPAKMDISVGNGIDKESVKAHADDITGSETLAAAEESSLQPESTETQSETSKRKCSDTLLPVNEPTSSKDSSQHSSVLSTPARSRTGSESSTEARPVKQDSSRRGSKVFSKAAMWENVQEKPPPAADKPRKASRSGGLNLSDLTKKFEEKPPADRKKPVIGFVKIADVKKSFENKSSEKVGFRRTSTSNNSSFDSLRDGSLPLSPSRMMKKEASLPPPAKPAQRKPETSSPTVKELTTQQSESLSVKDAKTIEVSDSKSKLVKEKSPVKTKATARSPISPTKETPKKEKSPMKDPTPKRDIPIKRDVASPKRTSPVKDKPKVASIAIKKPSFSSQPTGVREVQTSDTAKPARSGKKDKAPVAKRLSSPKFESSESSDSESEAERLLRELSERRERIEAAKKERLKKVSQQQQQQVQQGITKDATSETESTVRATPAKSDSSSKDRSGLPPLETPSDTPDDMISVKPTIIPKASMITDAEQPPGAKFATLPRGFKSRGSVSDRTRAFTQEPPVSSPLVKEITAIPPEEVIAPSAPDGDYDNQRRKKSEVEIVLSGGQRITPACSVAGQAQLGAAGKRASYAEIQLAAPQPPTPTEYKTEIRHSIAPSPASPGQTLYQAPPSAVHQLRTSPGSGGDGLLQRAPRERIIPIMLEDQDEDDDRSASSDGRRSVASARGATASDADVSRGDTFHHGPLFKYGPRRGPPHTLDGVFASPRRTGLANSRGSMASSIGEAIGDRSRYITRDAASPEPIRKSRRERIIPISVEGDDGTHDFPNTLDLNRPSHHHNSYSSSSSHGMSRRLPIERPESLSSNEDDEEEEDEDDGFQILTAESLFSTLLNRVRNLTRKMGQDDLRGRRLQHFHSPLGGTSLLSGGSPLGNLHHSTSPFNSSGSGQGMHGPMRLSSQEPTFGGAGPDQGGFWSSLYSPPRELSRQNSETSADGRGGERGTGRGGTAGWGSAERRSLSREASQDAVTVQLGHGSTSNTTPFNTLPRGWRTRVLAENPRSSADHQGGTTPLRTEGERGLAEEDTRSERSSGEAIGRVGGITEQQSASRITAARLASSADSIAPSSIHIPSIGVVNEVTHVVTLTNACSPTMVSGTAYNPKASAKNAQRKLTGIGTQLVQKQSSSVSTGVVGSDAREQLQKLVEELEIAPEVPETYSTKPPTAISSAAPSTLSSVAPKPSTVSVLTRPKSSSAIAKVNAISSARSSSVFKDTAPNYNAVTSSILPRHSPSVPKISFPTKPQIPESVAKISMSEMQKKYEKQTEKLNRQQHDKVSDKEQQKITNPPENSTMLLKSVINNTDSVNKLPSTKLSHSEIPMTVLHLSSSNAEMTASLPQERAASILSNSKINRSSVCIDNVLILKSVGLHNRKQSTESEKIDMIKSISSTAAQPLINGTLQPLSNGTFDTSSKIIELQSQSLKNVGPISTPCENSGGTSTLTEEHKSVLPKNEPNSMSNDNELPATLGRQKNTLTTVPYRKGKSEDLRAAIEGVGKIDSSFERYKRAAAGTVVPSTEPTIKTYRGSRSKELNPTIEAASEKISQLNSSNLKKISPFEAYRRSKSKELSTTIEQLQKQQASSSRFSSHMLGSKQRMTSPPPPGLPQSSTTIARLSSPPSPPPAVATPNPQLPSPTLTFQPLTSTNKFMQTNVSPQIDTYLQDRFSPLLSSPVQDTLNCSHSPLTSSPTSTLETSSHRNSPIIAPNNDHPIQESSCAVVANTSTVQRSKTPFERAKSKLERKIERAKSPPVYLENYKPLNNNTDISSTNVADKEVSLDVVQDTDAATAKDKLKKNSAGETDRPKSMYKMLTSKFNKSSSVIADENTNVNETNSDDKFKLKRPSNFLKGKSENNQSRSSMIELDSKEDHTEKKTTRKLSDALNKFLGRKTDDPVRTVNAEEKSPNLPSVATSESAKSARDITKIPSRYRAKVFSKSHENLNKYIDLELLEERNSSEVPNPNCTIESVTKTICDHLAQLENDITSRIGSMENNTQALNGSKNNVGVQQSRVVTQATTGANLNSYGYSPALANRRHGHTAVKDSTPSLPVMAEADEYSIDKILSDTTTKEDDKLTTTNLSGRVSDLSTADSNRKSKAEKAESVKSAPEDGRCFSPTSWCGDSVTSAPDDLQGVLSDEEEESVMDRITRKSFYSRFQDGKRRRSKILLPVTKQDEDQQLAAAKARLMEDDKRHRESLSPQRNISPPFISTRTSMGSLIPEWESAVTRRSATRSISRITSLSSNDIDRNVLQKHPEDQHLLSSYDREKSMDRRSASRAAAAAGAAAGYEAAERGTFMTTRASSRDPSEYGSSSNRNGFRDRSLSRVRSPSPPPLSSISKTVWSPSNHDTVYTTARDELSKRLTPLTRLASGRESTSYSRPYRRTTTTAHLDDFPTETTSSRPVVAPYRRTTTTGYLDNFPTETTSSRPVVAPYRRTTTTGYLDNFPTETTSSRPAVAPYRRTTTSSYLDSSSTETTPSSRTSVPPCRRTSPTGTFESPSESSMTSSTLPRPAYRRTNTLDLPAVTGSVINRPSDFRSLLQPVGRRYSTASIGNLHLASTRTHRPFHNIRASSYWNVATASAPSAAAIHSQTHQ